MNILLGLKALHDNDIVYRDLKPENLLIDFRGYIKLADFGLAKENVKEVTGASTLCGTAEYLAPEVLCGQTYGKCCDFWSLGCIIFELLECKPPFYDQNRKIMYNKILNPHLYSKTIKEISSILETRYCSNLKDLVVNLLIKDKTKRLGTQGGVDEVIKHPWFEDLDLEAVKNKTITAPYVPALENYGLNHFDELFVNESIVADEEDFQNFNHPAEKFYSDFSYEYSHSSADEDECEYERWKY